MSRIRTIKPEFFTSEDIIALPAFGRLLFIALWCEADKEGRLAWKPKTFKLRYFPADDIDIDALCNMLAARGLVRLYGNGYAVIPSFGKHQHINPREAKSTLPCPGLGEEIKIYEDGTFYENNTLSHENHPPDEENVDAHLRVTDDEFTLREEGKGREGKVKTSSSEQSPDKVTTRRKSWGTEEDHRAARWMFDLVQQVDQTAKEPNWDVWANSIRLIRERDGRTHREMCEVFAWANADSFWRVNVLCPEKLREKWQTLVLKAKAAKPAKVGW